MRITVSEKTSPSRPVVLALAIAQRMPFSSFSWADEVTLPAGDCAPSWFRSAAAGRTA